MSLNLEDLAEAKKFSEEIFEITGKRKDLSVEQKFHALAGVMLAELGGGIIMEELKMAEAIKLIDELKYQFVSCFESTVNKFKDKSV